MGTVSFLTYVKWGYDWVNQSIQKDDKTRTWDRAAWVQMLALMLTELLLASVSPSRKCHTVMILHEVDLRMK